MIDDIKTAITHAQRGLEDLLKHIDDVTNGIEWGQQRNTENEKEYLTFVRSHIQECLSFVNGEVNALNDLRVKLAKSSIETVVVPVFKTKLDLAREWAKQHPNRTRQEWLSYAIKELKMTTAGADTYWYSHIKKS